MVAFACALRLAGKAGMVPARVSGAGMAGEIFISYRRSDQAHAELLHRLLKERGVESWYDALLGAGEDWRTRTAQALVDAPIFVLLFSKSASQSDDIVKELSAATFQKKTVIPVRIEDIRPEGAFLYELASRNWFDAFINTEARFAMLADQLAALAKGGPAAQAAASRLGAQAPVAPKPDRPKRGWLTLGVAGIVAAAVLGVVWMGLNSRDGAAREAAQNNQRVAFFGFAAIDDDPAAKAVAQVATDETFASLNAAHIATIARGDTVGSPAEGRLARAQELGAAYVLSGETRRDGDDVKSSIRLEHAPSRLTIWEGATSGAADTATVTGVGGADRASIMTQCILSNVYADMETPPDADLRPMVARACTLLVSQSGSSSNASGESVVAALAELAQREPDLGDLQAVLASRAAIAILDAGGQISQDVRERLVRQASDALARATALRPDSFATATARYEVGLATQAPIAQWAPELEAAARREPQARDAYWFGRAATFTGVTLLSVGRTRDAVRFHSAATLADPTERYLGFFAAHAMAVDGTWEAPGRYKAMLEKRHVEYGWEWALMDALFLGVGDADALIAGAPRTLPPEVVECYGKVRAALALTDRAARLAAARPVEACLMSFDSPHAAMQTASLLGDLDAAFALVETPQQVALLTRFYLLPLFYSSTSAMRTDPRFLPLMERIGFVDYWTQTGTSPDICDTAEERDIPLCVALRAG
jgi:TolB-like protein